jgi:hypothetical protein
MPGWGLLLLTLQPGVRALGSPLPTLRVWSGLFAAMLRAGRVVGYIQRSFPGPSGVGPPGHSRRAPPGITRS